jgi:sugar diacid utilization regulator
MEYDLEKICEAIKSYDPLLYVQTLLPPTIREVRLLTKTQLHYKEDTLYLCDEDCFENLVFPDQPINLLCLARKPIHREYLAKPQLNLILIKGSANIIDIYNEIFFPLFYEPDYSLKKIVRALLAGKGLQSIVDTAYQYLELPIIVYDLNSKALAYSQHFTDSDIVWDDIRGNSYCSYERINDMKTKSLFEELYNSNTPVMKTFSFSRYRWMAYKITINGKVVGHTAIMEYKKPFEIKDGIILKFLCEIISCEMQRQNLYNQTTGRAYEAFLLDLLEQKALTRQVIDERLKYLDLVLKETLYLLTVRPRTNQPVSAQLHYLKYIFESRIPGSKVVAYKNNIVILISRDKKKFLQQSDLDNLLDLLKENNLDIGVSRAFFHLEHMQQFYVQSCKSIELGVNLNPDKRIFCYDDYALYHLLDIAAGQTDLISFCHPAVFQLLKYDEKNNSDYTHSLYIYLCSGCNLVKAAKAFNIHRNSMEYRINKTQEILNINLSDPEVIMNLNSTFRY